MTFLGAGTMGAASIHDFTMDSIEGTPVPLGDFKGKVTLVVNVASRCGFTPQYTSLEATYRKYEDRGFVVLGFPANNFRNQEPATNAEIRDYLVTAERAGKLSGAWGRHPLLGRMYLPAYRAGTELVADLRRRHPPERILPVLYGCSGLVDVTTVTAALGEG